MIHLIVGLVCLVFGAWGIVEWWNDFGMFLRGVMPFLLVIVGLSGIGAGFRESAKDAAGSGDPTPSDSEEVDVLIQK